MALYMLVFIGGNPVGAPMVGWLAQEFGGRSPFLVGGAMALLSGIGCGVVLARRRVRQGAEPSAETAATAEPETGDGEPRRAEPVAVNG